jgi:hypothetical protein
MFTSLSDAVSDFHKISRLMAKDDPPVRDRALFGDGVRLVVPSCRLKQGDRILSTGVGLGWHCHPTFSQERCTGKTIPEEIGRSVVALYQKASIEGISLSAPAVRRSAVAKKAKAVAASKMLRSPLNFRWILGRRLRCMLPCSARSW